MNVAQLLTLLTRLPAECKDYAVGFPMEGYVEEITAALCYSPDGNRTEYPRGVVVLSGFRGAVSRVKGLRIYRPGDPE